MYRYDINTSHLLLLFFSFIIVILLALLGVILYAFKKGLKTTTGTQLRFKQLPAAVKFLLCVPLMVAILLTVLIGRLGLQYIVFEYKMNNGEGMVSVGEVHIVSCEENWYRDEFMGYNLEFEINRTKFAPSNSLPEDVVRELKQGGEYRIIYGYIGSDLTIWSIDRVST